MAIFTRTRSVGHIDRFSNSTTAKPELEQLWNLQKQVMAAEDAGLLGPRDFIALMSAIDSKIQQAKKNRR